MTQPVDRRRLEDNTVTLSLGTVVMAMFSHFQVFVSTCARGQYLSRQRFRVIATP